MSSVCFKLLIGLRYEHPKSTFAIGLVFSLHLAKYELGTICNVIRWNSNYGQSQLVRKRCRLISADIIRWLQLGDFCPRH